MKFKKTKLENGLRIVSVPMPDSPTVTVLVLVEAGSKYETKEINGLSHFLEHMCFKGTKKRSTALQISSELDGIGSQNNAFTSHEYTGYYAKSSKKHFDKILDIVSDIYLNPVFDEKEVEKEKGVIIDEINMYEDMPNRHVHDLFGELLYGDQPAGRNVAGTKEIIRKLKREDFINYRAKHYVASGTIVVVVGNVGEKEIENKVKEKFAGISTLKKEGKPKVIETQNNPEILLKFKETDQTHLVMGVRAFDAFSKKRPILSVLSAILGGGMSSRLFQKLRDEMGVGYYVKAGSDLYTDHGFLAVWTGVTNSRVEEVIQAILKEFEKIKNELVSIDELNKVKEYLIGNMYLELESTDSIANFYGGQEVIKADMKTPEQYAEEISIVTAEDIQALAEEIFKNNALNMAMIGPFKDKNKFESMFHLS
ncbi:MAG: pitrilysin family protein [Patescibacteria group bacterium]|mgnify:CR=1 FL=1